MSTSINSDTRAAWQDIANECAKARPSQGKRIRVLRGKRKGFVGIVIYHGIDKFQPNAYRYCSGAQAHMRDLMGRADNVEIVS